MIPELCNAMNCVGRVPLARLSVEVAALNPERRVGSAAPFAVMPSAQEGSAKLDIAPTGYRLFAGPMGILPWGR